MTRRTTTMTTAAVVFVALVCVALLLPVPYVTMQPGPTRNVLAMANGEPVVAIEGSRTYPTDGSLSLTTVSVTSAGQDIGLVEAVRAWFSDDDAVVPRDAIYPPTQSEQEAEQESTTQMTDSQDLAAVAALRLAGDEVPEVVGVAAVTEGSPAEGELEAGDVIAGVDGQAVGSGDELQELIQARQPGEDVTLLVRRTGEPVDVTLPTVPSEDDASSPVIGIEIAVFDYELPFDVTINLGSAIGGPSAGTVFALAIYDKLTEGSLTGGMAIAGTGTIDAAGRVGAIGGIQQKILGARAEGATVFLVPANNCGEASGVQVDEDITLVEVGRLSDAVDALTALADDPSADVPTCG